MKKRFLPLLLFIFTGSIFAQDQMPSATNATAGKLTVQFSTTGSVPSKGMYVAVYISNNSQLINTLYYATSNKDASASSLSTWWSLIGNSWNIAKFKHVGTPDGFSGATKTSNITNQTIYWGNSTAMATSVAGIADGNYKINFEYSDYNGVGHKYTSATFAKGPTASVPTVPAMAPFTSISVSWAPVTSALNNPVLDKMYNIYPNPAISSLYVSGSDIKSIEVCNLEGKSVFITKNQKLDVSELPKGTYLAVITAKEGTIVKKIVKL